MAFLKMSIKGLISSKRLRTSSLLLFLTVSSCNRVGTEQLEPQICYTARDTYLKRLPDPFTPLTSTEKKSEWGKEYQIGLAFARELDLYRAITAFKRAEILLSHQGTFRKKEVQYNIMLSYYLGKRYEEALETFNTSELRHVQPNFAPYHDLLIMLYESNKLIGNQESAELILDHIRSHYPETADKLTLSTAMIQADFETLTCYTDKPYVAEVLSCYTPQAKSIERAELFNALLPGAGYAYVGQRQSAVTAFLLNGLFIGAAVYFFLDGNVPAGIIATSFEAGWYFGGIYGAGEAAKHYNERKYEGCAYPVMTKHRLFPILTLNYGF